MTLAPEKLTASQEDVDGVMDAVRAYIEGYVNGDPEHHARAYHPEAIKRRLEIDEPSGVTLVNLDTPTGMVEYAANPVRARDWRGASSMSRQSARARPNARATSSCP